jgi:hypothetical protein
VGPVPSSPIPAKQFIYVPISNLSATNPVIPTKSSGLADTHSCANTELFLCKES